MATAVLIEDDPLVQEQARAVADEMGIHLITHGQLGGADPHGDLLILDVDLPDGSGLSYLEGLTARGFEAPVVMLTASAMDPTEGYRRGATHWIRKSGDIDGCLKRAMSFLPDMDHLREMATQYPGGPSHFGRLRPVLVRMVEEAIFQLEHGASYEEQQKIGHQLAVHATMFRHPVAGDLRLLEAAARAGSVPADVPGAVVAGLRDLLRHVAHLHDITET